MPLKIYIRHYQLFDRDTKQPVVYVGTNPANLSIQFASVPQTAWIDATANFSGLEKLKLSWELRDGHRVTTGITGQMSAHGEAYKFIKGWVNDHIAAPLNAVEIRIEDVGCVNYLDFLIKADGLEFCDVETCNIDVTAKQADEVFNCIQTTRIADDHLGWFNKNTTKKHPRFSYCDKISGFLLGVMFTTLAATMFVLYSLTPIIVVIGTIVRFFNSSSTFPSSFGDVVKFSEEVYKRAAGCGRQHPSPLVRDYILNVCMKCGVNVTAATVPAFFDPNSDYYNLAYYNAEAEKGLVAKTNKYLTGQSGYWIPQNEPLLTLDMFLDKMAVPFNAEWRIINNTLYFGKKNEVLPSAPLFDFAGTDKAQLLTPICYTWNGDKKPAYLRGVYQKDATDATGNEANEHMNDIVEFNAPINPMLEGEKAILSEFGMQRYLWDSGKEPYLSNAAEFCYNTLISMPPLMAGFNTGLKALADLEGFIYTTGDTALLPKLIIWDGIDPDNARAVYTYARPGAMPMPNTRYNKQGKTYDELHYYDRDGFAVNHINSRLEGKLFNYPMFFDAMFKGNLYDRFFDIEDPRSNPLLNKTWELNIYNCCDNLKRLGVDGNGNNIAIGRKVRLFASGYYTDGIIESVEVSYDVTTNTGKYIKLRGRL